MVKYLTHLSPGLRVIEGMGSKVHAIAQTNPRIPATELAIELTKTPSFRQNTEILFFNQNHEIKHKLIEKITKLRQIKFYYVKTI